MSLQSPLRTFQASSRLSLVSCLPRSFLRFASLNSAIGRGIRKSQRLRGGLNLANDSHDHSRIGRKNFPSRNHRIEEKGRPSPPMESEFDEDEFIRTGNFRALPPEHQRFQSTQRPHNNHASSAANKSRTLQKYDSAYNSQPKRRPGRTEIASSHKATDRNPERVKEHVKVPDTIPYTTPASEFIYGTTAVEAALHCTRRQIYKLYLYQATDEELSAVKVALRKLALSKNIKVKMAFAGWDRLLDKMSAGRPHNGCILEASPLPKTPVKALRSVQLEEDHFRVELAPQTREEALINGTDDRTFINHSPTQQQRRYPVVLLLDGILDPGNLGAIIRSAYYLGVDAVIFAGRNSAPISPVTIKASAGAAENMALLGVKNEVEFIQRSKANGWRFYAADALNPESTYIYPTSLPDGSKTTARNGRHGADGLIGHSPSVIMMGSEGSGLSHHIRSHADYIVSIPGARLTTGLGVASDPARVDSLNVSVAAALLMEMFLRVPLGVGNVPQRGVKSR